MLLRVRSKNKRKQAKGKNRIKKYKMNRKNYNIEKEQSWVYLHVQATPRPLCHGATYFLVK